MIFLPLVENAFKHGINKNETGNFVHIDMNVKNNTISFTVKNRIQKVRREVVKEGELGIDNLKKRLSLIFNENYQLNFNEIENTFNAELKIPIK